MILPLCVKRAAKLQQKIELCKPFCKKIHFAKSDFTIKN